jgi:hypothetical protein
MMFKRLVQHAFYNKMINFPFFPLHIKAAILCLMKWPVVYGMGFVIHSMDDWYSMIDQPFFEQSKKRPTIMRCEFRAVQPAEPHPVTVEMNVGE